CEVEGVLIEKRFQVDDVVQVGDVIAIIETEGDDNPVTATSFEEPEIEVMEAADQVSQTVQTAKETVSPIASSEGRFYSPLVKNIAKPEAISQIELDNIIGTGKEGRVTKDDILAYIEKKSNGQITLDSNTETPEVKAEAIAEATKSMQNTISETPEAEKIVMPNFEDEVVEMT